MPGERPQRLAGSTRGTGLVPRRTGRGRAHYRDSRWVLLWHRSPPSSGGSGACAADPAEFWASRPVCRHTPLTVAELGRIVSSINAGTAIGIRDRAVILLGYASAMRPREVSALDSGDIITKPAVCPAAGCSVFAATSDVRRPLCRAPTGVARGVDSQSLRRTSDRMGSPITRQPSAGTPRAGRRGGARQAAARSASRWWHPYAGGVLQLTGSVCLGCPTRADQAHDDRLRQRDPPQARQRVPAGSSRSSSPASAG